MDIDSIREQIRHIEEEISKTPYHKGTEHHIGRLRAKLARLRDRIVEKQTKKSGGGGTGFAVKKFGDATVTLVGFPSVGKSTLLNKLTNAKSPTAEYAFTTLTVIPGMMRYKGASIQILDVPGLIEGASKGSGRGREVLSVIRGSDLILIIGERGKENFQFNRINKELYLTGVRINQEPPKVDIKKTLRGGLKINYTAKQNLDYGTIREIAKEFNLINAEISVKEDLTLECLIDAFAQNRVYIPALYLVNKNDQLNSQREVSQPQQLLQISAKKGLGIENLKEAIWQKLKLVRIYLRRDNKTTDYNKPLIMQQNQTLQEAALEISSEFAKNKKGAKIWGPGAKHPGQQVSLSTKVQDEMEVLFL